MRLRTWTFLSALLLAAIPGSCFAQACCAGAGVFSPSRLRLGEDVLVGTQVRAHGVTGSSNALGLYVPSASSSAEHDFDLTALATARVLEDGQVGLSIPFVMTRRSAQGDTEL